MNLKAHYSDLWENASKKFSAGEFEQDTLINSATDTRAGITLRARPDQAVLIKFRELLNELTTLEADQYYYPESNIHTTIMSIISCYAGFNLSMIRVPAYSELIHQVVQEIPAFEIEFKGITASPSTIMIQGFPKDDSLQLLRDRLRIAFNNSGLEQTLDKRYTIRTAHCTIVRFRKELTHAAAFLQKLQEYRTYYFGSTEIRNLELVHNDWYHRKANVLDNFILT